VHQVAARWQGGRSHAGLRLRRNASTRLDPGPTRMSPRPSRCGAGSLSSSSDRVNRVAEKSAVITRARFYEPPAPRGANRSCSCHRDAAPRQRVEPPLSLLRDARHSGAVARPFVNRHDADARRAHAGEYDDAKPSRLETPVAKDSIVDGRERPPPSTRGGPMAGRVTRSARPQGTAGTRPRVSHSYAYRRDADYGVACCVGSGASCTATVARLPFLTKSIATFSPGSPPITTLVTSCGRCTCLSPTRTMTSPGSIPA
jgi:hypothetical protein